MPQIPALFYVEQAGRTHNVFLLRDEGRLPWGGMLTEPVTLIPHAITLGGRGFHDDAAPKRVYVGIPGNGEAQLEIPAAAADTVDPAPTVAVTDALEGAWFSPTRDGQGLFVEVDEADDVIAMGWYTAHPVTHAREWYTLAGQIDDEAIQLTIFETSGVRFMRPAAVSTVAIGTATLRFTSCTTAEFVYSFATHGGSTELHKVTPASAHCAD